MNTEENTPHKHKSPNGVESITTEVCEPCKDGMMKCNNGSEEYEIPCPSNPAND